MVLFFIHFFIISQKCNENLNCCTFMVRIYVILWTLSSLKIHLWTKSNFFHVVFAESFRPNPQVSRNTFDFFHLCNGVRNIFYGRRKLSLHYLIRTRQVHTLELSTICRHNHNDKLKKEHNKYVLLDPCTDFVGSCNVEQVSFWIVIS